MKRQIIFSFYISDNTCNNWIYQMHYDLLEKFTAKVDKTIFVISYDEMDDISIIYNVRAKLIKICKSKEVTFVMHHNDKRYREGLVFKKHIIDKLDDYDDYITFFGHTKGVSNKMNWENPKNLMFWIYAMYYMNFEYIGDMTVKLTQPYEKYICYGTGFYPSYSHFNNHNWFYSGSFCWINTKRLSDYIKKNNIDVDAYVMANETNLMRCAELFLGYVCPHEFVGFLNDKNFNKEHEPFRHYTYTISYQEYETLLAQYIHIDEFVKLKNTFNEYAEKYIKMLDDSSNNSTG